MFETERANMFSVILTCSVSNVCWPEDVSVVVRWADVLFCSMLVVLVMVLMLLGFFLVLVAVVACHYSHYH